MSLREFRGRVQLELSEGCAVVAVQNVPAEARGLLPDVCAVASLGAAQMYTRVYFKARVLEPGELRTTATGEGLRTVRLSDVDGRVAVAVRVFGPAAEAHLWGRGNIVLVKNGSCRPDQNCVKIDREASVELLERAQGWRLAKGTSVSMVRMVGPGGGSGDSDRDGSSSD